MRITLARQELCARVWSEPVQKLSHELGISDRGLAKLCARHDILASARGYWAKMAAGKPARQGPLPEASDGVRSRIDFPGRRKSPSVATHASVHPLIPTESDPGNAITVSVRPTGSASALNSASGSLALHPTVVLGSGDRTPAQVNVDGPQ